MSKQISLGFHQLLVCLSGLSICVGYAYAFYWVYEVFFIDNAFGGVVIGSFWLIGPVMAGELLIYLLLVGLITIFILGIAILWMGLTDWESVWGRSEKSKREHIHT